MHNLNVLHSGTKSIKYQEFIHSPKIVKIRRSICLNIYNYSKRKILNRRLSLPQESTDEPNEAFAKLSPGHWCLPSSPPTSPSLETKTFTLNEIEIYLLFIMCRENILNLIIDIIG